jgi:hypothetical protein
MKLDTRLGYGFSRVFGIIAFDLELYGKLFGARPADLARTTIMTAIVDGSIAGLSDGLVLMGSLDYNQHFVGPSD